MNDTLKFDEDFVRIWEVFGPDFSSLLVISRTV